MVFDIKFANASTISKSRRFSLYPLPEKGGHKATPHLFSHEAIISVSQDCNFPKYRRIKPIVTAGTSN
jgi:hypothetical protein